MRRNPEHLPPLVDQLQVGVTLRFITTGYGATSVTGVTFANLLDSWMVATSATTGFQLFDYVKVRRVTVRATANYNGGIQGGGVSCEVGFSGLNTGVLGSGKRVTDSALGVNNVAFVSIAPGEDTLAGKWQASNNGIAFVIRIQDYSGAAVTGAVIDLDLSFKNEPDVSPVAVSSPVAAAVAGNLYYRGIDGGGVGGTWARSAFGPRV